MTSIRIAVADDHPTILFAATELQRCLAQATGQPIDVLDRDAINCETVALWLGLAQHIPGAALPLAAASADAPFDDAISIATEAAHGIICGINPRSVLRSIRNGPAELNSVPTFVVAKPSDGCDSWLRNDDRWELRRRSSCASSRRLHWIWAQGDWARYQPHRRRTDRGALGQCRHPRHAPATGHFLLTAGGANRGVSAEPIPLQRTQR
jgi:hypothetical protein